jgi:hypothetical protein
MSAEFLKKDGTLNGGRTGNFFLCLINLFPTPSCSLEQDEPLNQECHRAEFYKGYYRVAEENDKKMLKSRKEDLDTLLIFVSSTGSLDERILIRMIGWSVFRRRHRIHHPSRVSAPARPGQ